MEDARRNVWLPSRPATDPETLVAIGPRHDRNSSDRDLLKILSIENYVFPVPCWAEEDHVHLQKNPGYREKPYHEITTAETHLLLS